MPGYLQVDSWLNGAGTATGASVDSAGRVTFPNQVMFSAWNPNLAGSFSSGSTLIYGSVNYNPQSAYNSTTGIFTAPVAGRYWISAEASPGNWSSTMIWIALNPLINGSYYQSSNQVLSSGWNNNNNQYIALTWSGVMNLAANDQVKFNLTYNTFNGNCGYGNFSGFLMG